ncbi:MAG: hypothetical protein O2865_10550 [Planctomycetota bacterium]|nr:hypothetical protein [Planctomycetota bacterium]
MSVTVRSSTPSSSQGSAPQLVHRRFTVDAPHEGLLMVRVRDPLATRALPSWSDSGGSKQAEGLAQRVLDLGFGEASGPAVVDIELRIEHERKTTESVRVHFEVTRDGSTENWHDFYRAVPATRRTRSNWSTRDTDASVESGSTMQFCMYSFGGDGPIDVLLNPADQQQVLVELGWKSAFDLTR